MNSQLEFLFKTNPCGDIEKVASVGKILSKYINTLVTGYAMSQGANALSAAAGEGELSSASQLLAGAGGMAASRGLFGRAGSRTARQLVIPSLIGSYIFKKQKENFGGSVTDPKVVARLAKQHTADAVAGAVNSMRASPQFRSIFGYNGQTGANSYAG